MPSGDSISRYDPAARDMFQVGGQGGGRNPQDVADIIRRERARTRDSIATSEATLLQQAQSRLHANNFQLPNEKLVAIARVGKYLFVAVTLPPYLLMYAVPKYVAQHLLPALCQLCKQQLQKLYRPIEELMMQLWQGMQRFVQTARRRLRQVVKAGGDALGFLALWRHGRRALAASRQALHRLDGHVRAAVRSLYQRQLAKLAQLRAMPQRVVNGAKALGRSALDAAKGYLLRRFATPIAIAHKAATLVRGAYAAWRRANAYAASRYTAARTAFIDLRQLPGKGYRALLRTLPLLRQRALQRFATLRDGATALLRGAKQPLQHALLGMAQLTGLDIAARRLQNYYNKGRHLTMAAAKQLRTIYQGLSGRLRTHRQAAQRWLQHKGGLVRSAIDKYLIAPPLRYLRAKRDQLTERTRRLTSRCRALGRVAAAKAAGWLEQRFRKPLQWLRRQQERYRAVRRQAVVWADRLAAKVKRGLLLTRLMAGWMQVLVGFWMVVVRRLADSCIAHCTWRDLKRATRRSSRALGNAVRRRRAVDAAA